MKRDSASRQVAILGFAVLGFIGPLASAAWANGEEFFAPAKNSKIDLVYFGRIKEIGEQIDVSSFVITVNVAGYKRATITRMPRKAQGAIELDVKLEPVVSAEVLAAGLGSSDTQPYTKAGIILIGCLAAWVIAKVARTSNRPPTPTR